MSKDSAAKLAELVAAQDVVYDHSMTLFAAVAPDQPLFEEALRKFFGGERDPLTIQLLASNDENSKE